jgi:hypothetical protein
MEREGECEDGREGSWSACEGRDGCDNGAARVVCGVKLRGRGSNV